MKYLIILSAIATAVACTPSNAEDGKDGLKLIGSQILDGDTANCLEIHYSQAFMTKSGQTVESARQDQGVEEPMIARRCDADLYNRRCVIDHTSPSEDSVNIRIIQYTALDANDLAFEAEGFTNICTAQGGFPGLSAEWQTAPFSD